MFNAIAGISVRKAFQTVLARRVICGTLYVCKRRRRRNVNYCILHQLLLEPYRDLTPTTVQLESNWRLICTKLYGVMGVSPWYNALLFSSYGKCYLIGTPQNAPSLSYRLSPHLHTNSPLTFTLTPLSPSH